MPRPAEVTESVCPARRRPEGGYVKGTPIRSLFYESDMSRVRASCKGDKRPPLCPVSIPTRRQFPTPPLLDYPHFTLAYHRLGLL